MSIPQSPTTQTAAAQSVSHVDLAAQAFRDDVAGVPAIASFDNMPLHDRLLRGIYSYGFENPSAIQQRAIAPMSRGGDIIAQAQSGTGKTGAFSIGLLTRMDFRRRQDTQALVLSPTRELANQTCDTVAALGEFLADSTPFCYSFVGGTRVADDIARLRGTAAGAVVAVGTPGRILDLVKRGALRTDCLKVLVLDEADEMLSQGFAPQVQEIFRFLPRDIQVALFSATMPPEVLQLSTRFMRTPTTILLKPERLTLEGLKQFYVAQDDADKIVTLADLFESISVAQSVIFANTRRQVDYVSDQLNRQGHTVAAMHSDMIKGERDEVMKRFRSGAARVLVTTDLVARGIDVQHVNVVVNFDLPCNIENYLHRIGRSARYGRRGVAINLVSPSEVELLRAIQAHYHTPIDELPMDFMTHLAD